MGEAKRRRESGPMLEQFATLLEGIVSQANANEAHMDGTMKPVLEILNGSDLVFAVWHRARGQVRRRL